VTAFPPDLPDLLRIACGQGKLRLNVWISAQSGHQANLANAGDGWTVHSDADPLVAITEVLRIRYGGMLERQRQGRTDAAEAVHPAHRSGGGGRYTGDPRQIDIEEAIERSVGGEPSVDVEGLIG
jgi:hypothetical protein